MLLLIQLNLHAKAIFTIIWIIPYIPNICFNIMENSKWWWWSIDVCMRSSINALQYRSFAIFESSFTSHLYKHIEMTPASTATDSRSISQKKKHSTDMCSLITCKTSTLKYGQLCHKRLSSKNNFNRVDKNNPKTLH